MKAARGRADLRLSQAAVRIKWQRDYYARNLLVLSAMNTTSSVARSDCVLHCCGSTSGRGRFNLCAVHQFGRIYNLTRSGPTSWASESSGLFLALIRR